MERLKELREIKGLNQQGLALKMSVSQSTISYYETGERTPDLDFLIQLADYFDVSIDYLVGRSNIKKTNFHEEQNTSDINFYHDYLRLTKNQKRYVSSFLQGLLAEANMVYEM